MGLDRQKLIDALTVRSEGAVRHYPIRIGSKSYKITMKMNWLPVYKPTNYLVLNKFTEDEDGNVLYDGEILDPLAYIDPDPTLAANSDELTASQKAIKTYTDGIIAAANAMVYKGVIDCSGNPNYPSADAGHIYIVSIAGKIGGVSGVTVDAGDMLICKTDGTLTGDHATVGAQWNVVERNLVGAVLGPASAVDGRIVAFDGVTGKLIKDSGSVVPQTEAGSANNFLTTYDTTTGVWGKQRPTWDNIDKTTSSLADITTKSHTVLSDIGSNTHAQIDTHIANTSNPHGVTKVQVGLGNVDDVQQLPASYLDTDATLAANSDVKVASQKATKTYADTKVPQTRTVNGKALSSNISIDKTDVGLSDVTNHAQVKRTEMGAADGVATLDGGGKVPVAQLPSSIMQYQGVWNATTNTPTLVDGVGNPGDVYRVSVAGTQNLGSGAITFNVGDYIIYNGSIYEKSDTTDSVPSVFGRTGDVEAQDDDYTWGQIDKTVSDIADITNRSHDDLQDIGVNTHEELDEYIEDILVALDTKVDENAPITGATKTKVTYDAKGLVTSGEDATTADVDASTDRNYVTDAQLIAIGTINTTVEVTDATQTIAAFKEYIANRGTLITFTLPVSAAFGDCFRIGGKGAGGWKIAQNANQVIHFGNVDTTTGTGGHLDSTRQYDCVEIVCIAANTHFLVRSSTGNLLAT